MKIHEILEENIIKDYYTANIKAEVIFDMVLTPVIDKVLTIIGQKYKKTEITGEMKLIAKEFPMLQESESNYRNCNADYLMCDENSVYLVELKTTQESLKKDQMDKYLKYLDYVKKGETFANTAGRDFINLLNHVSLTGYSDDSEKKPWGETNKTDLKLLFETILNYSKENGNIDCLQEGCEAKDDNYHVNRAIFYLRNKKADSSKKYLLTAGQMLDHMKYGNWWNCDKIKLLYLMPEIPSEKEKTEGVIIVTFQEIIKQAYVIGKEMEKLGLKSYWEWVAKILVHCGLY